MDEFCGSQFWDWNLTWYSDSPDLTPCFERTVLSVVPCAFLWLFCGIDLYSSCSSNSFSIPWSPLFITKEVGTLTLILLEVWTVVKLNIILPSAPEGYVAYPVDFYEPAFRALTLMLSLGLLIFSSKRGVRNSGVQFLFWLLLALTQAARFQTLIRQAGGEMEGTMTMNLDLFIIQVIYFPVVLGQLILHCWTEVAPESEYGRNGELTYDSNGCPEMRCSFLSRILFEWYTPLAWTGFRKPLEHRDLWSLDWNLRSSTVIPGFDLSWSNNLKESSGNKEKKKVGVLTTLTMTFGTQYLSGLCIRVIPDLMVFVSPLILNLLIDFVESDDPPWKGILYSVILFLNDFISTTLCTLGIHMFSKLSIKIKSSLISAVYRKALLLSAAARRDRSSGEIGNHMAVDIQYISDFSQRLSQLVTPPLVIGIALYFLWTILGVSAIAGVVVMVLLLPLNALVASRVQKLQKQQMAFKDKRIKLMTEILNGIKCLKLHAWEPSFQRQVSQIRDKELVVLKQTAYWSAVSNFLWTCAPFLVTVGTFGMYVLVDSSHVLDAKTAFVSLSLFNIMSAQLTFMPFLISCSIQTSVGLKRLTEYLNADEIDMTAVTHDQAEYPVVIDKGNFSWDCDAGRGDTLQDINLEVKDGELVAIVGPVGSGKSSLLSALLNELVKTAGRVNVRGDIAYVAQQAWIQNATVRDNILFGRIYEPGKYQKVIEACALIPDLEMLPAGDKTEIGEKGINLSGGQKQRVSLARAVYSDAQVFLLDDPLSAVDAHVGKHIFEKVLGPKGLLRKKTRLLVTHGVVYLPQMDNILVMGNGRINEKGSYQALLEKNGTFADFLRQHGSEEDKHQDKPLYKLEKSTAIVPESEAELKRRRTSNASSTNAVENKLIEVEKAETASVKASVYRDYVQAAGWTTAGAAFVMYLIFQGFSVGANLWLSKWTSVPTAVNGTTQDPSNNTFYLGVYGALGFFQAVAIFIASVIIALGTVSSAKVLHFKMLERILRAPLQFFDVTPIGRIINRFSRDVDSLDNILPPFLRFLINSIFSVLAVLVVVSVTTPLFTAVILPVALLYYLIQRFYVATSRQLKRLEGITRSPIFSHFGKTVSGASTIRAYRQQERFILESERRQDCNMVTYYASVTANRWLQIRLETVGNSVVFFAALFAVLGRDTLNAGMVGLSVSYALQITTALIYLVRLISDVETNIVAVERIKEYSNCPQEAPWQVPHNKPERSWPDAGAIEFDQFKVRYRPGLELVLRNVTCEIRPGEKVGIVGRTGAGKSSVTLGIFRIVEAAGGRILVDGKDISGMGLHDVRDRITIIPQEPTLFSGSLKLNLDPFEEKREEKLWRALEWAHLKQFVEELPGGLNYEVAEGGENLSVGQRQLVCLARALLRKTKILVLDEASSALDLDTEELILKTIRSEFQDATVITIAHRINTIMDSDRVLVLEKGEIVEFDTPSNLLQNSNSMFSGLATEAGISFNNCASQK